jgi:murein DD-endopeptidase MepM/ murein hydrolase activator NlpD
MNASRNDFKEFTKFLIVYHSNKTKLVGIHIEKAKNTSVKALMHRRGRFQKHIVHSSIISLASVGILSSGVMGSDSLLASSFPGAAENDPRIIQTFDPDANGVSLDSIMDFKTSVSEKPRSEIIEYEVKSGETLSQIAEKFGISTDTIKWANDMSTKDSIKPGQKLKILPVTGVAVTTKKGDTLEGLAKKYQAEADAILQFPFNNISDDLKLKVGDLVFIPDGQPPEVKTPSNRSTKYIAQSPTANSSAFSAPNGAAFIWPTTFQQLTTRFAWWHPGIDMANRSAPGVAASDGGAVVVAGWPDGYGYGNRVVIDHGNGYRTLYAHLSNIYVSVGQKVSRGQAIGQMGNTGRSTGTHLHFEIHYKGIAINPLAILK